MCAATERWVADAGLAPDAICDLTPPAYRRLTATSRAPGDARAFLMDRVCPLHTRPAIIETAALLVSELVTNAVRHAAPPISLTVGCARAWLVVEVADGTTASPHRTGHALPPNAGGRGWRASALDEGGRGVPLVEALSDDWGCRQVRGGKVTWFRLAL